MDLEKQLESTCVVIRGKYYRITKEDRILYDGITSRLDNNYYRKCSNRRGPKIDKFLFDSLLNYGYIYTNASLRKEFHRIYGTGYGTFYAFDVDAMIDAGYY